ncbi:MAG: hypothetical protein AAFU85_33175, partial [Planctomycetota bacterium]
MNGIPIRVIIAAVLCVVLFLCIKAFVPIHIALAGTVLVGLIQAVYLAWLPKPLNNRKPRWNWFPKYHFRH